MNIRPTTAADIPAITRVYAEAVIHGTATFELEPPSEAEMAARLQQIVDGGYPYLTAEADGAFAGYAYAAA
jgi:phosphinothricin acetyltransferase